MKETPISNIEKSFITEAIFQGKRTDGRHLDERRNLEIHFGHDYGSCLVSLGQTKVSAQVSCSVLEPRPTRPNEGLVFIHVEFLPMSSPRFVSKSKISDEEVNELTRILERNIKESRAVDTESLCIVAEEQVFAIRLDIKVLNHEGNVIDCSSIAALAALCHFRRPDVSVLGDKITIHTVQDKDPVKLSINHYPVCTTYGFFCNAEDNEKMIVKDPIGLEEAIMDGKIVLGMNPYKEICTLHLAGKMLIDKSVVLKLVNSAAENAKLNVELIKKALERDENLRSIGQEELGLVNSMKRLDSILNNERKTQTLDLEKLTEEKTSAPQVLEMNEQKVQVVEEGIVEMVSESESESDVETVQEVKAQDKTKVLDEIDIDDDSEEEEIQTLKGQDLKQGRNWYPSKLK